MVDKKRKQCSVVVIAQVLREEKKDVISRT